LYVKRRKNAVKEAFSVEEGYIKRKTIRNYNTIIFKKYSRSLRLFDEDAFNDLLLNIMLVTAWLPGADYDGK